MASHVEEENDGAKSGPTDQVRESPSSFDLRDSSSLHPVNKKRERSTTSRTVEGDREKSDPDLTAIFPVHLRKRFHGSNTGTAPTTKKKPREHSGLFSYSAGHSCSYNEGAQTRRELYLSRSRVLFQEKVEPSADAGGTAGIPKKKKKNPVRGEVIEAGRIETRPLARLQPPTTVDALLQREEEEEEVSRCGWTEGYYEKSHFLAGARKSIRFYAEDYKHTSKYCQGPPYVVPEAFRPYLSDACYSDARIRRIVGGISITIRGHIFVMIVVKNKIFSCRTTLIHTNTHRVMDNIKLSKTRHVSSMIHLVKPTVSPVANIVFTLYCFPRL